MILLDTHVVVWATAEPERLSTAAKSAIRKAQEADGMAVAAITLWELAVLLARGRIQAYGTIDSSIKTILEGVTVKPITPEIAVLATQFPEDYLGDPADRLIGATARAEGMMLITRDEKMRNSGLFQTIW